MDLIYWRVVLRYGHVGHGNSIAVARHIVMPSDVTIIEVNHFVQTMPGVKSNGVLSLEQIDEATFLKEKEVEDDNFYIQNLKQKWPEEAM